MEFIIQNWHWFLGGAIALVFLLLYRQVLWLCGVIIIPDDSIGLVTKKFVIFGKRRRLPDGRIVALNGEAGYQADTLAPGLHFGLWFWQYRILKAPVTMVPQGEIALVLAADGEIGRAHV